MDCSTPGLPVPYHLLKFAQVHVHCILVMTSSHLILWCPLLLLPSVFPSIRVFSSESCVCIRWQNTGASASASLLPVSIQGWSPLGLTGLISLPSKGLSRVFSTTAVFDAFASVLQHSAFFMLQLSLPYMTIGKTTALTTWPLSLLLNTLLGLS